MRSSSINQRDHSETDDKPQKSLNEKQQENQELLVRCITQHLGFACSRPIAACIIYKCLLHWRSFEVERTSVFDKLIQSVGHAIEVWKRNQRLVFSWFTFEWFQRSQAFYVFILTENSGQQWCIGLLVVKCFNSPIATPAHTETKWSSRNGSSTSQIIFNKSIWKDESCKIKLSISFSFRKLICT